MRVLLAVDHSPASKSAVAFLRALPFGPSVDLQIVTVISPAPFTESLVTGAPPGIETLLDQERRQVESILAELMAQFHENEFRSVSGEVRIGAPGQELAEFAERHNTNLVVMAAVGRSALNRVMLGSVSEFVANRAQSSVLIVRSPASKTSKTEAQTVPRRVMLALDNSAQDVELATWIRRLELPTKTEIHFVHVMQLLTAYRQDLMQQMSESWEQSRAAAKSHADSIVEAVREWDFDAKSNVIAAPHLGDALISYAGEHGCDLIIAGDRRRGALNRLLLGSVSRHVLRYSKCNVLVARGG